jgi:hypothetical protein
VLVLRRDGDLAAAPALCANEIAYADHSESP